MAKSGACLSRPSNVARSFLACAAFSIALAQAPVIGDINFYGLHRVTPERILSALNLKPGSPLPPSKGEMEDTLANMPGVVLARVEAICCEGSRVALFIGLEEKGDPHASFRSSPAGDTTLPQDLIDLYHQYLAAVERSAARGTAAEDLTAGHSRIADPEVSSLEDRFAEFAASHLAPLRDVLRNAAEGEQRAVAATVIGYAPNKPAVVNDLQYALQDPDESVRANAARSLKAIAVLAVKRPELGIRISPTWLVELLHSVVLSDRLEATSTLLTLTDRNDRSALDLIRARALVPLAEMARWKTPRYALPPFLLLGRVAGFTDAQVEQSWQRGDRDSVIQKALAKNSLSR